MAKHILLAEDERAIAHAFSLKLQKKGFEVTHVTSGAEALAVLEKGGVDLFALDLMMPGMDGFTLLKELQEKKITIPTVVTSNLGQEEDRARVKALGVKEYFVKSDTPINTIVDYIADIA